ncbi:N-acetylmuramoyl-L-alanine amidase [Zhaonella formicivorans]|uniref:N-acetylmuramoyl-L-alanine amidase n=1 Tax=Zhaonella formicivorans TaxID=2528593 RepID=UPI0010DC95A7|nr:N-acetylmuramoyl-L-alanine amidase [Zhaonella formicivorans]
MAFKVGIDPGHGGKDSGAVGKILNVFEKDITLKVAQLLNNILVDNGFTTFLSRKEDVYLSLRERADFFNKARVDLIISIHVNSSASPEPNYISTHILSSGGSAEKFAIAIQKELVATMKWPDGGVRENNFYILRETEAPAVLVELGFISNEEQEKALLNEEIKLMLASALARGIAAAFHQTVVTEPTAEAGDFQDIKGHWAEQAIRRVVAAKLMSGYGDKTFRPEQNLTRAEFAVVLVKLLDRLS